MVYDLTFNVVRLGLWVTTAAAATAAATTAAT